MKPKLKWSPMSSIDFFKNTESSIKSYVKNTDKTDQIKLLTHQKIVKAYMNPDTPFRGILLYHGLGSGKTLSAIGVSEGFKNDRKTVVFLPGQSLEDNFIHELEKCGNKHYIAPRKNWYFKDEANMTEEESKIIPEKILEQLNGGWFVNQNEKANFSKLKKSEQKQIKEQIRHKIAQQYQIIRYNGVSKEKLEDFKKNGLLDNKLVIVDEAHNVVSMITNYINDPTNTKTHIRGRLLYDLFMNAKNTRFIFLSGTPIINYPKELSVIFNILRGPITMFKYNIKLKNNNLDNFSEYLRNFPYIDYMKVTDTNIEVSQTQFGFSIKDGSIYKDDESPTNHVDWVKRLKSYVSNAKVSLDIENVETNVLHCFPCDKFNESFIEDLNLKNLEVFMRRISGLVSYYGDHHKNALQQDKIDEKKVFKKDGFPTLTVNPIQKLEMSKTQYIKYEKERLNEVRNDAKKTARKMSKMFEDEGSELTTYRARSLAICNFTYPLSIEPDEKINPKNRERILEELKNKFEVYCESLKDSNISKAFYELSPKYWTITERIEKLKGTSVVYSHLKNREGLSAMFTMLHRVGWKPLKISFDKKTKTWSVSHGGNKTYILYGDKADENREYLRKIFNSEMSDIPPGLSELLPFKSNLYGEVVKTFFITSSGAEGITLKNVRQIHVVEHHWSEIRVDQVIGRVNRLNSHIALPENERTVEVYKYATVFGKLKVNELLCGDNGKTSDEAVINTALRKKIINDKLLQSLIKASIDCAYHKIPNCYQLDNNSYHPDFDKHIKDSKINIAPQIKLSLIKLPNKSWIPKKFHNLEILYDKLTNTVYDKESVEIGRPKEIAMMIKKEKAFMPL
mgnify:FL=1|tara:strand:+ start:401 stop:2950 length:2550 start_codon:yes stop_codon:yes gene_type:complete